MDGKVTAYDALVVLRHVTGITLLESNALLAAEVSGEDVISPFDALLILRYVVGLIDCFPADPACSAGVP